MEDSLLGYQKLHYANEKKTKESTEGTLLLFTKYLWHQIKMDIG